MAESPVKKPSLFRGSLVGYLATALFCTIVYWFIAARSGNFDNQRAGTILVSFGAAGALAGYEFMAWRLRQLGVSEPSDGWRQFSGSWTFYALAAIVIVGSFAISVVESLLFDLVHGAPWLQNR
jgi:hypothetical protein